MYSRIWKWFMASSFWNYVIQIWAGIFKPLWRSTQNLCFNSSISKLSYMQNYHSCTLGQNIFLYSTIHKNATVVCVLLIQGKMRSTVWTVHKGWVSGSSLSRTVFGRSTCVYKRKFCQISGLLKPGVGFVLQSKTGRQLSRWMGREGEREDPWALWATSRIKK